jgi:hypothetical protein
MTRAARQVGLTDNGLRKMAIRMKVLLPPQGYWFNSSGGRVSLRQLRAAIPVS